MRNIFIGYPAQEYQDSPAELLALCKQHPEWYEGWQLRVSKYGSDSSLNAKDFCSMVLQSPGPVVLLQKIQMKTFEEIRRRLGSRLPILLQSVTSIIQSCCATRWMKRKRFTATS